MKRARARNSFPVGQIKKLRLQKNDLLIVTARRTLSIQDLDNLRDCLRKRCSNDVLICQDIAFTTLSSGPSIRKDPVIPQPTPERRR